MDLSGLCEKKTSRNVRIEDATNAKEKFVASIAVLRGLCEKKTSRHVRNEDPTNAKENFMHENEIAKLILDSAFKIHKEVGPGLLESVYEELLAFELGKIGLSVKRQVGIPLMYESIKMEIGFRADLIVENKVIVELKSIEAILDVHKKVLLTYLKLSGLRLGLLINFNVSLLKEGIVRIVNRLNL